MEQITLDKISLRYKMELMTIPKRHVEEGVDHKKKRQDLKIPP